MTVDRKLTARNGQIVIALVDGRSTVEAFRKDRKGITLMPKNKRYMPIKILPENDFQILRVVTNVNRKII